MRCSLDDRAVFGVRELVHDHADEQPFTRSQTAVTLRLGPQRVEVQARPGQWMGGAPRTVVIPPPS